MTTHTREFEQARSLFEQRDYPAAISHLERLLEEQPGHTRAHELLGLSCLTMGRWTDGIGHLRAAVTHDPHDRGLVINLAAALLRGGQGTEAATWLRAALARFGAAPDLLYNLALAQSAERDFAAAIDSYRECLELDPQFAEAHNNLGSALEQLGREAEAIDHYRRALAIRPAYVRALANLGTCLRRSGRLPESLEVLTAALALEPQDLRALCSLGLTCHELGQFAAAVKHFERALAMKSDFAEAWNGKGMALGRLARYPEALASYTRALECKGDYASARWNKALLCLTLGNFPEGWPLFEARFAVAGLPGARGSSTSPSWRGQPPLEGRSILVQAEYGLGDTIQFSRYAALLGAQGVRTVLEVPPSLKRLLATLGPAVEVIAAGEPTGATDFHCPLLSLPLAFGTQLDTIPAAAAYLGAEPHAVRIWKERLPERRGLRIGIAWRGNATAERDALQGRSIPVGCFTALLAVPRVSLVVLQKDADAQQLAQLGSGGHVASFAESLDHGGDAFIDTAAIMVNLDLVITCDTAIAHLAGALGVPVWVALHTGSDWRWLMDRSDSPWYPSMRLFRQRRAGDWDGVFRAMTTQLHAAPAARQ